MSGGVARSRIDGRGALRLDLGCSTERGIVEDSQILLDCTPGEISRQAVLTRMEVLAVSGDGDTFLARLKLRRLVLLD